MPLNQERSDAEERIRSALIDPEDDWVAHAVRVIESHYARERRRTVYDVTTLGDRIRTARALAGMTQRELAKRLSMTQYDISGIERSERALPIRKVPGLCISLGVSRPWLLGASAEGGPRAEGGVLRHRRTPREEARLRKVQRNREAHEKAKELTARGKCLRSSADVPPPP